MPGTLIRERTAPVQRSGIISTGPAFIVGLADKGLTSGPASEINELVQSVSEFEKKFGTRQTYSSLWDVINTFFREGGTRAFVSRVVGPAAVAATRTFTDAGAGNSLIISAKAPGDWGNLLNVAILAGDAAGEFKVQVTHDTDTSVNEISPSLVDQAAAISWSSFSDYIRITLGATALDPAVIAAQSLAGGTDDRTNITDAQWLTALNRFGKDLGPGQVLGVNRTSGAGQGQLCDHAVANNRVALCDTVDTATKATVLAAATTFKALSNARYGALFTPWINVPGITPLTQTAVQPSAVVAGIIGRNDGAAVSPNEPAAGELGQAQFASGVRAAYSDTDRNEINAAAGNVLILKLGGVRVYGFRSGADKTAFPLYWNFGNTRLYMAIAAQADNILERFVLKQVDGRGLVFKDLEKDLVGMLIPFYDSGSLYGSTPEAAFFVDTGPGVNTPGPTGTIANGEIHAAIELTMSPMGETVILDIVRLQIQ